MFAVPTREEAAVLAVRESVRDHLRKNPGVELTANEVSCGIDHADKQDWVFKILENLAVNEPESYRRKATGNPTEDIFSFSTGNP